MNDTHNDHDDDDDAIDIQSQCRVCGKDLYTYDETVQIYELTHHWGIQKFERETPNGPMLLKDFAGEPFELLGKFCSAECLVAYVKADIEPDTRGSGVE